MPAILRFDPPTTAPVIDHPRPDRLEGVVRLHDAHGHFTEFRPGQAGVIPGGLSALPRSP